MSCLQAQTSMHEAAQPMGVIRRLNMSIFISAWIAIKFCKSKVTKRIMTET